MTKKLWAYIKKNGLQDKKNKRMINADATLKAVFGGKGTVNMFEMTKLVSKHLKWPDNQAENASLHAPRFDDDHAVCKVLPDVSTLDIEH